MKKFYGLLEKKLAFLGSSSLLVFLFCFLLGFGAGKIYWEKQRYEAELQKRAFINEETKRLEEMFSKFSEKNFLKIIKQ